MGELSPLRTLSASPRISTYSQGVLPAAFRRILGRGVQVRLGAMEEEAVRRDEVRAARAVLGVQAAAGDRAHHQAHPSRQGAPPRLQG